MKFVLAILTFAFFAPSFGQIPSDSIDWNTISIEELMNLKVTVAGKTSSEIKNTPGIITVISADDIKNNQCRDLIDVFNMVPGFAIAKDDDFISFTSRGLYSFEGRALFLLDGHQLSDLYFGSFVLGNELPVHLIEKIEIIRGPGSVIYGGTAELTVINIITKEGKTIDGIDLALRYGQLGSQTGHQDIAINAGKVIGDFDISLLTSYSEGIRSGGSGSFLYGGNAVYNHNETSAGNNNSLIAFKTSYKNNTNLQINYTASRINELFAFDLDPVNPDPTNNVFANMAEVYRSDRVNYNGFYNLNSSIDHKIIKNNFTIQPSIQHQYNHPFTKPNGESVSIQRIKPALLGIYKLHFGEFLVGGEYFNDLSRIKKVDDEPQKYFLRTSINEEGKNTLDIYNYAFYSNLKINFLQDAPIKGTINGGLRVDKNELFDAQISPRIGVNFYGDKFYTKLLFNKAFRAPLAGNNIYSRYGLNPDTTKYSRPKNGVTPEHLTSYEIEGSYNFTKHLSLTMNVYYQYITDIIEFRYNPDNSDLYSDNGGKIGTKGIEAELKYKTKKWNIKWNYSFMKPVFFAHKNNFASAYNDALGGETYITPDAIDGVSTRNKLLAVPSSKTFFSSSYRISKTITVNFNSLFLSNIWLDNGDLTSRKIDPQLILGSNISYQKIRLPLPLPYMTC